MADANLAGKTHQGGLPGQLCFKLADCLAGYSTLATKPAAKILKGWDFFLSSYKLCRCGKVNHTKWDSGVGFASN